MLSRVKVSVVLGTTASRNIERTSGSRSAGSRFTLSTLAVNNLATSRARSARTATGTADLDRLRVDAGFCRVVGEPAELPPVRPTSLKLHGSFLPAEKIGQ